MTPAARRAGIATLTFALLAATADDVQAADDRLAPDALAVTAGYASGAQVAVYGVAGRWNLTPRCEWLSSRNLDVRLDAQVAYWNGLAGPTENVYLWDFGLTPMLRWTSETATPFAWFAEGGIGIHGITSTHINNDRQFGIAFQFGEIVGTGVAFGPRREYELEIYLQHVSNADIKSTANWGLTYPGIVFRAALR